MWRCRAMAVVVMGGLLLAGCGVFGGGDAPASATDADVVESNTVRVTSGDRFFDIAPASLVDASGATTADAADTIAERVAGLALGTAQPNNAGVIFDGTEFVVNPSIPGSTPDIDGLVVALTTEDLETVDVPFLAIQPDVSDDDAAEYAAELNERVANGVDVAVGGQKETLPSAVLGEATTVDYLEGEWVVSIDYAGIADELSSMFPDVGAEGGEATFTVEPGEGDEPGTVVIVPGAPATICCDDASINRIISAMTSDLDTATLTLANVDGERGGAWAEGLGIQELVGSFTTQYTPGQDRNINIQRIAEITQGHIIEPGETWSLNERVGQRTRANGFVPAGTIVNGHLTDSVGGGISQYATTIFNASFFAGLEFDQYQAHSIYFSRYPYGREATISWPAPQLEIHNPTPYGILIWPTTTSSSITVDLYSTKWVDAEQTGQSQGTVQVACTRVTTERTRTFLDGTVDVDSVFAIYRQEGIGCDGEPTDDPDAPPPPPESQDDDADDDADEDENDGEANEGEENPDAPPPVDPDDEDSDAADPEAGDGDAGDDGPDPDEQDPPNQPNADESEPDQTDDPAPDNDSPAEDEPADGPAVEDIAAPAPEAAA